MTWKEKAKRVLALGACQTDGEVALLRFFTEVSCPDEPPYQMKALIDVRLADGERAAAKAETRTAKSKRRQDRRYERRHGQAHPLACALQLGPPPGPPVTKDFPEKEKPTGVSDGGSSGAEGSRTLGL